GRSIRHDPWQSSGEVEIFSIGHFYLNHSRLPQSFAPAPSSLPKRRSCGEDSATAATTISVPRPPLTTEKIGPKSAATVPDSNRPSSFDALMNIPLTAETLPRISSGVRIVASGWRTTTLMLWNARVSNNIPSESQKFREKPKTRVAGPKPATAQSNVLPALFNGERCVVISAIVIAPSEGAACKAPRPAGPTRK